MIVASITGLIVVSLIVFALHPLFQYVVASSVAALAGIAIWEYERFAEAKGGKMITPVLIFFTVCEVLAFYFHATHSDFAALPLAVFFIGFLIIFAMHFREKEGAIVNLAVSAFGLLYIALPVGMILGILYSKVSDGRWWMGYLLLVTKITDIGAYFAGSLWGKRRLAPTISPKKTVEGASFGLLCALFASFLFSELSSLVGHPFLGKYEWIFLGVTLGIVGQFGDLAESLLKRDAQKKDSNTLPGLGGALDAIDSILFNAVIIFIYVNFVLYKL